MIFGVSSPQFRPFASYKSVTTVISPFMDIYIPFMDIYIYPIYGYSYYTSFISVGKKTHPICSMVLECLPTFARTKSPSFVGKYPSTMEHMA